MALIDGHKTHIGVVLYILIGGLLYVGFIDTKTAAVLGFWVTAWTGYALRNAIQKMEP